MKLKFSIGLILMFSIVIYLVYNSLNINQPEPSTEPVQIKSVSSENHVLKENGYYLFEKNGYVVVYLNDKQTPYEYTDILVSNLPYDLMNEIKNGKYIDTLNELYGFLENYSS